MYNIDSLIRVVEEANENIANTIKKADAINKSIDDINQEKYEKVNRWMLDVKEVSKKIGHTLVFMKLPSINLNRPFHNAAKIYIDQYGTINLGLYIMGAEHELTKENWKKYGIWERWIGCTSDYRYFIHKEETYVQHFCTELINNWDLYEKECYENLKDWALEAMAEKAKEAEGKYSEAVNKYEDIN